MVIDTRSNLHEALQNYSSAYTAEMYFVPSFLQLLQSEFSYQRNHLPGHITGSAWIVDESKQFVLLTHHAKLNTWLQPGGHADGDENVLRVALREAEEETGVKRFTLLQSDIFDIDIHPIPERKDFAAHDHYDIRFLIQANKNDKLVVTEESHDLAWVKLIDLAKYNEAHSLQRMAEKVQRLF